MIHIYCGDGKGKTTAAVGLAVRCAGAGGTVLFYQFMKPETSSERIALQQVSGITVLSGYSIHKFSFQMQLAEKETAAKGYRKQLSTLLDIIKYSSYTMLVLDEIIACISAGFLTVEIVLDFLKKLPDTLEVVMTGRNPNADLLEQADYISEIQNRRHPFEKQITARKGIEF